VAEWVQVDQTWTAAFGPACDGSPELEVRQYAAGRYTLCVRFDGDRSVMRAAAFPDSTAARRAAVDFAFSVLGESHREQILGLSLAR
jgi:hypothetical protein